MPASVGRPTHESPTIVDIGVEVPLQSLALLRGTAFVRHEHTVTVPRRPLASESCVPTGEPGASPFSARCLSTVSAMVALDSAFWIGIAVTVVIGVTGIVATLLVWRPTPAAARAEARKLAIGFDIVGDGGRDAPGYYPTLKGRVCNESSEAVLAVRILADLGGSEGLAPWWQAGDGLQPGECRDFRLPATWPCAIAAYHQDHLERCWRQRVNGEGNVSDVERVPRRKWPRIEPPRPRWWRSR